ncbi:MAG: hypothetical protein R3362_13295, partial [Rhodothermales bacterium]|nr:hypothetical protein [Rhodothermales bacterium]
MKLKLLAPVRTDFSVVTELPIREPDRYARFWDDVAERKDERRLLAGSPLQAAVAALRFPHGSAHRRSPYNRYQSLESDALERPLHVLEVV